jgi:hypothetical protein
MYIAGGVSNIEQDYGQRSEMVSDQARPWVMLGDVPKANPEG